MSFVRKKEDLVTGSKKLFGGNGECFNRQILNGAEEMYGKGRLFNHIFLEPGCEVGWHVHHGDGETYYILKGQGEYNDNGTVVTLHAGDMSFVGDGEGHAMKNTGNDTLEAIALILYSQS